jgi:medium-chain acyl-[acyl-carrier-protein] hydrolase
MWIDSPWLNRYQPRPDGAVRLLCFPHAGSSAAAYGPWADLLPADIEVCAVEYPGRGSRRSERPFVRVHALVAALIGSLGAPPSTPFAVFGHSLGALIGFELVRQWQRQGGPAPLGLFVAGCRGPSLPARKPPVYALPDEEFIEELRAFNGTPPDLLENRDLLRLFLPSLRADFELADTYGYRKAPPLRCPIVAYGGSDDTETLPEEHQAWQIETQETLTVRLFPGDHFFLRAAEPEMLRDLTSRLLAATTRDRMTA